MTECVKIGDCELYNTACLEVLRQCEAEGRRFDALVTDPPYGIGVAKKPQNGGDNFIAAKKFPVSDWDDDIYQREINVARSLSRHSIVFGGNYYNLPPTSCWLVWDKNNGASNFADCELAWTNFHKSTRIIRLTWNGMIRAEKHIPREVRCQKPIGLMRWCLSHVPDAETIIDPFMGGGSTGIAAVLEGRRFVGVEAHPETFEIACRRIREAYDNPHAYRKTDVETVTRRSRWLISKEERPPKLL